MSTSINRATLLGFVGKDPTFATTKTGKECAHFSMATSQTYTDKASGVKKTKTQWHNIVVWNQYLVESVRRFVFKGTKVLVEGSIENRKWVDQRGVDRYTTEIILNFDPCKLIVLGGNPAKSSTEEDQGYDSGGESFGAYMEDNQGPPSSDVETEDEIPF